MAQLKVVIFFMKKLTVPAMNLILLSLLPMRLIRLSHRSSLAAANGQFMLFKAGSYREQRYHEQVRGQNLEDMAVIRLMKQQWLQQRCTQC